jgi:nitrous oxidase accessory protein NosD
MDSDGGGQEITENQVSQCTNGLRLSNTGHYILTRNSLSANQYNLGLSNIETLVVETTNTVDGKPVYLFKNATGFAVPLDAGYVALYNCTNASVTNLVLGNNYEGVWLEQCTDCLVDNITVSNMGYWAILINGGQRNKVTNSSVMQSTSALLIKGSDSMEVTGNAFNGSVWVTDSPYLSLKQNTAGVGGRFKLGRLDYATIQGNTAASGSGGMDLEEVRMSTVSGNTILGGGLTVNNLSGSTVSANTMRGSQSNLGVQVNDSLPTYSLDETNTVNGKPVRWWNGISNRTVPADTGILVLVNCSQITASDLAFTNNSHGVLAYNSTHLTLQRISSSQNDIGIEINGGSEFRVEHCQLNDNRAYGLLIDSAASGYPSNATITYNRIARNGDKGIFQGNGGPGNFIYLNSLIDNPKQVDILAYFPGTTYYSPSPLSYTYKGNAYSSRLGNRYSDYTGLDGDDNGIGDTAVNLYNSWGDRMDDNYPLMWDPNLVLTPRAYFPLILKP